MKKSFVKVLKFNETQHPRDKDGKFTVGSAREYVDRYNKESEARMALEDMPGARGAGMREGARWAEEFKKTKDELAKEFKKVKLEIRAAFGRKGKS